MKIYAKSASGYLQKASGINWDDCLSRSPSEWPGGDLYLGKRYWVGGRPPRQNWALWRPYLSFDTSALAGKTIKSAWLVFTIKERGAAFNYAVHMYSHGTMPWGDLLEPGDWPSCNKNEGFLYPAGLHGTVWKSVLPASINRSGKTQFRLNLADEVGAPTGDEHLVLYGPDTLNERPYLMINTGNVNDDICQRLAEILEVHKAELGVNAISGTMLHTVDDPPEIQIGWETTTTIPAPEYKQRVTVTIWWLEAQVGGATAGGQPQETEQRQKADLIRRILLKANNPMLGGYCTGIEGITEDLPDVIQWAKDGPWYRGVVVTVTYIREIGEMELL